jgi:hypothetical protein
MKDVYGIIFIAVIYFDKKFHEAIREGRLTLTFRLWDTLRVLRGKIYRSHNLGLLRVLDVDFKRLKNVALEDIKRCGYEGIEDFYEELSKHTELDLDPEKDRVVRIEFEYIGEDIENYKKAMGNVKDSEIFNIKEQLLVLEQKHQTPWIRKALQLLKDNTYMFSKDLEPKINVPSERIKVFMRRLKTLHLVASDNRKGYSITPLGVKLLKHLSFRHAKAVSDANDANDAETG